MWVTENKEELINMSFVRSVYVDSEKKGVYNVVAEWSTGDPNTLKTCKSKEEACAVVTRIKEFLSSGAGLCDFGGLKLTK